MEPIKRFTNSVSEGNLWIYVLSLAKEVEIQEETISRLIFEKLKTAKKRNVFPVNLVLEEAHRYISTDSGSKALVGSSKSRNFGCIVKALAIATLCC